MSRGKRSSQCRNEAWRERTGQYYTQRVLGEIQLTSLIKQARMKPAADRHKKVIPVLCGCLQSLDIKQAVGASIVAQDD